MKINILTLGCKVNQYESGQIADALRAAGHEVFDGLGRTAELCVINTCAVTGEAERKSRQAVKRALRGSPDAKIIVCGCASENDKNAFIGRNPGVLAVFGAREKQETALEIAALIETLERENAAAVGLKTVERENTENGTAKLNSVNSVEGNIIAADTADMSCKAEFSQEDKTRAYIKVQDGCDYFCSYCLIPYLKGRSRSRAPEEIVSELHEKEKTHREIVLIGINLSDYGKGIGLRLPDLIRALAGTTARIRLGSLEAGVIDAELLGALKGINFCPHFHLSLQSGCDKTLREMNRHYTAAEFLEKVALIRRHFPGAGITTDVICGFPTETEEDFLMSMATVRAASFSDMHIFPYSARSGTRAAKHPPLDAGVVRSRCARMEELRADSRRKLLTSLAGGDMIMLTEEGTGDGFVTGFSEAYIKCYLGGDTAPGQLISVRALRPFRDGVIVERA